MGGIIIISIDQFIDELSNEKNIVNVLNQYSFNWRFNSIAKNNLRKYLLKMKEIGPTVMLIGEAPGYKGCKWTCMRLKKFMLSAKLHNLHFQNWEWKYT